MTVSTRITYPWGKTQILDIWGQNLFPDASIRLNYEKINGSSGEILKNRLHPNNRNGHIIIDEETRSQL